MAARMALICVVIAESKLLPLVLRARKSPAERSRLPEEPSKSVTISHTATWNAAASVVDALDARAPAPYAV